MIKPIGLSAIPTPNFLEVRSRNSFRMNLRMTLAEYEFSDMRDAQTTAGVIMADIMERIAVGNIGNVDGWQFKHHDNSSRGLLPKHIGCSIRPLAQHTIRIAAGEITIQLRGALVDERQRNYRPDYVAISGLNAKGNTTHPDTGKHELRIRWFPPKDVAQFSTEICVLSPLSEDENTTPFFTLDSLRTYVGLK